MQYESETEESSDSEDEDDDLQRALAQSMELKYNQGQASDGKAGALERASQPVPKVSNPKVTYDTKERSQTQWCTCARYSTLIITLHTLRQSGMVWFQYIHHHLYIQLRSLRMVESA